MFTFAARDLGQPAFLSEVYERLEAVPGVIGVRIGRFDDGPRGAQSRAQHVITVAVDEWLRLLPSDLILTISTPVAAA
jgi:hypothetical protein